MTPEQWQRMQDLCLAALEQQSEKRSEFLETACDGEPELRRQIEELMCHYQHTGSFLEAPLRSEALRVFGEQIRCQPTPDGHLPGDVLLNRYRVVSSLGRGGMGEVYAVDDLDQGRRVALKTIRGGANYAQALYRFKQEFRSLADLQHPNLIRLYDLVSDGQSWMFTMELVDGVNFLQYVRPDGNLIEDRLRQALTQLVPAVEALHHAGKLHLDIKPSNVLVMQNGHVLLIDFGLVTELLPADATQTANLLGTPAYMAPEQYGSTPLSEASDWYSIGIMLYEVLTGRLPFSGSPFEIYRQKFEARPVAPADLVPEAPEDLSALCAALLERAPGVRPSGEEILRRVSKVTQLRTFEQARSKSEEAPFVGRETELQVLEQAYVQSRSGHPVLVSITGASGIGKTAVVRHFLQRLEHRGENVTLLTGRCYERESVPFKAIDSVLDSLTRHLSRLPAINVSTVLPRDVDAIVRLFPVLQQVETIAMAPASKIMPDPKEARRRAFAALKELLARLSDRCALVIFIDDMQWSDTDSFALLDEVIGGDDAPSVLVVFTHRSGDMDANNHLESLSSLVASKGIVRNLQVGELSCEDSLHLAASLLGAEQLNSHVLEAIARESAGIPLFIDQLAHFHRQTGERREVAERVVAGSQVDELNFAQFVASRIGALPAQASSVLELLALAAEPLRIDQLKKAAGFDIYDDAALPTLRTGKFVKTKQKRNRLEIEMYHDRIRDVVEARMAPDTRRQRHLALGISLEECGDADPASVASHFEQGEVFDKAALYSELAAEQATAALAFDKAARLYENALRLSLHPEARERQLRISMAEALVNANRGREAAAQYLQAGTGAAGTEALQLQQRAAEQLVWCGYLEEGLSLLKQISAALGLRLTTGRRLSVSRFLFRRLQIWLRGLQYRERNATSIPPRELLKVDVCWSLATGWSAIDSRRGVEAQALHLLLALRSGEPGRVALGLAGEGGYATLRGRRTLRHASKLLRLATEVATRSGNAHALGVATFCSGMEAWMHGNFARASEFFTRAGEIYLRDCKGVIWERETTQIFRLACFAWMGRLSDLSRILPPLRRDAEERGNRYATASLLLWTRYWLVHLADDNPDLAEQEITTAIDRWPDDSYYLQHFWALLGKLEIALYRGDAKAAAEAPGDQWRALRPALMHKNPVREFLAAHLEGCRLLAAASVAENSGPTRDRLLRAAGVEINRIRSQELISSDAMAYLFTAGVAAIRSDTGTAIRLYEAAERGFQSADMCLYVAAAMRRRGELLGGDQGRALITAADDRMRSQGVKSPSRLAATLAPAR
jgi:eukaryotic-like serine/threonine-protein kinase